MRGLPYFALRLQSGNVLIVYGYRREPYGIRCRILDPECTDPSRADEFVLRDDGGYPSILSNNPGKPGDDLGYPISTQLSDGSILTVYYITVSDGVTHVAATRWRA